MWYRVGKYVVDTGASSRQRDQWVGRWLILEEAKEGLVPVTGGWDGQVFESPMDAANVGGARGVDEARRMQDDMQLEFSDYTGPYPVTKPHSS